GKIDNDIAQFVKELLIFFGQAYKDHFGFNVGPIHDACTTMYLMKPELFEFQHLNVSIETKGEFSYVMTVVDKMNTTSLKANTYFSWYVDEVAISQVFEDV